MNLFSYFILNSKITRVVNASVNSEFYLFIFISFFNYKVLSTFIILICVSQYTCLLLQQILIIKNTVKLS